MKKILTAVLAIVFCFALSLPAFAAELTIGADGNATYDTAIGFEFRIDDINGKISGEDSTICTTAEALDNCGVWAIYFVADKVADNVYKASTDGAGMAGSKPTVTLGADQIIVVVHSSTSDPTKAETFPNWEQKVSALAVKTGDYFYLEGVDLAAGTAENGKMTCMTKEDAEKKAGGEISDTPSVAESDTPSEAASEAESVIPSEAPSAAPSEAASEAASAAASSSVTSEMNTGDGFPTWAWIAIGAAVAIIIVVVVVVISKKNK